MTVNKKTGEIKMSTFFTRYNNIPKHPGFDTGTESNVRQSEQESCDINIIMDRFNRTGKLPRLNSIAPAFIDARGIDYQRSLDIINNANDAFMQLPANTRKYFNHDPGVFLDFFNNYDENKARELGLTKPIERDVIMAIDGLKEVLLAQKEPKKEGGNSSTT